MPIPLGFRHSEETRRKMSASRLGKKRLPLSAETRRKISLALLGKKPSEETRKKLRARICSEETRQKIRAAHLGRKISEKTREKITKEKNPNWRGGRIVTDGGYIMLLDRNHPNATKSGYIAEHRKIFAGAYGKIEKGFVIHHIDGNKQNNQVENLMCFTQGEHLRMHRDMAQGGK